MSGDGAVADLRPEREIDLARWRGAIVARWWVVAAGLVAGALIGGIYPLTGGTTFNATILIARGQAFAPNSGTPVLTYLTSVNAIDQIATSPGSEAAAAAEAGVGVGELRHHVATLAIDESTGEVSPSGKSNLVELSVSLTREKPAKVAVTALARIVEATTSSDYVVESVSILQARLAGYAGRIKSLEREIASLRSALSVTSNLASLDRLVVLSQLDQAEAAEGQTLDSQNATQEELLLSQNIERTQVINEARAEKSIGRTRRNSILVGALIGIIIAAMVAVTRRPRAKRQRAVRVAKAA